ELGSRKTAVKHLDELITKYPRSPRAFAARLNLADLQFESGSYSSALRNYLLLARDSKGKSLETYVIYKLAWTYSALKDYSKAILAHQRVASITTNDSGRVGFRREALAELTRLFALDKKYAEGDAFFNS